MQQGGVGPTVAPCGGHTDSNIKDRGYQNKALSPWNDLHPPVMREIQCVLFIVCFKLCCVCVFEDHRLIWTEWYFFLRYTDVMSCSMLVTCYIWNPNSPRELYLSELLERRVIRQIFRLTAWHHCGNSARTHTHTQHALTSTKLINLGSYLKWGRPLTQAHWDQFLTLATLKQQVLLH